MLVQRYARRIASLNKSNVWTLVTLLTKGKAISVRWTFDINMDSEDVITRFKAHLVGKCYTQMKGVDYSEVFSSVSKYSTVRLILALIAKNKWKRMSLDSNTSFRNASLDQKLYARQTGGFENLGQEGQVHLPLKALYGLK